MSAGYGVENYRNTSSGLAATNIQDAIDELADEKANAPTSIIGFVDNNSNFDLDVIPYKFGDIKVLIGTLGFNGTVPANSTQDVTVTLPTLPGFDDYVGKITVSLMVSSFNTKGDKVAVHHVSTSITNQTITFRVINNNTFSIPSVNSHITIQGATNIL